MRFSLRIIISGAKISCNLIRRLLRFNTLLYKSFKSDVANLPPSSWTIGLKSGGITGNILSIIHEGSDLVAIKLSIILNLFIALSFFVPLDSNTSSLKLSASTSKSISLSNFCIASAPIPTSTPYISDCS